MRSRIPLSLALLLTSGLALVYGDPDPKKAAPPAIPDDFQIVAQYGPGYSDLKPWKVTIAADGKVVQEVFGGRTGAEASKKELTLKKEDIAKLVELTQKANFFKLKERYSAKVTDNPTLFLTITADKKTHKVAVYAYRRIQGKEDQDAVDGFLNLWSEVLRKVPSPNAEQTADWYKPGNYVPLLPKKPPE